MFAWVSSIAIPDCVTRMEEGAFEYCQQLQRFVVSPDHPTLGVADGALYDKVRMTLLCLPVAGGSTEYRVPEGMVRIGEEAFGNCRDLKRVTLPESLLEIGKMAFRSCTGLTELTLPQSLTVIEDNAFTDCQGLKELVMSSPSATEEGSLFLLGRDQQAGFTRLM